jgi:hypothetical protein
MANWQVCLPLWLWQTTATQWLGIDSNLCRCVVFFHFWLLILCMWQVAMIGALAGVAALFIANKMFDWGFLGRPVYLVDFFCFRPPER